MPLPLIPWPVAVHSPGGPPLRVAPASAPRALAAEQAWAVARRDADPALAAEAYSLEVDAGGIAVHSRDEDGAGAAHARRTLAQLLEEDAEGWVLRPVSIEDAPRFAHRGVMLDVARHFFPVPDVLWFVDRIAELKFTHLHLHLTDDQGWRLELRSRPELTARGSSTSTGGDPGGFFTQDDWRAILAHATSQGIVVVPEFDLPGHTHAVGLAYPELCAPPVLADTVLQTTAEFGGDLPRAGSPYTGLAVGFSSLRAGDPAAEAFLVDVLGELCGITPGPYVHIGGDEALGTDPADYADLVAHAARVVAEHGKVPVAWHEAGAAPLPPRAIGQFWGYVSAGAEEAALARAFVANGGRLILSPADAAYLDMKYDESTPLGLTWADGPTSVERAYTWEPAEIVPGIDEDDVLGVEAALWTETVRTRADVERMAFPRLAAVAEIAWSPREGSERSWPAFRARLGELGAQWDEIGIRWERSAIVSAS